MDEVDKHVFLSITCVCMHAAVDHEPWRHHFCWHRTTYTAESKIATNCQHHQFAGRFLGMMGPNASVSKSNQLHGVIFRFVFINSLRFSPFVGQHSVWIQVVKSWRSDRKSSSFFFLFLCTEWLHEFRIACRRNRSALRPPFTQKNITYAPFPPDSS